MLEEIREKIDQGFKEVKDQIKADNESSCNRILQEVRKMAAHSGANICGICDSVGHKGRDCPKLDLEKWCRICGDNYHLTKNCKEDKRKCGRCGKIDHHATKLHKETDLGKRMILIREFGDLFKHFLEVRTKFGKAQVQRAQLELNNFILMQ